MTSSPLGIQTITTRTSCKRHLMTSLKDSSILMRCWAPSLPFQGSPVSRCFRSPTFLQLPSITELLEILSRTLEQPVDLPHPLCASLLHLMTTRSLRSSSSSSSLLTCCSLQSTRFQPLMHWPSRCDNLIESTTSRPHSTELSLHIEPSGATLIAVAVCPCWSATNAAQFTLPRSPPASHLQ